MSAPRTRRAADEHGTVTLFVLGVALCVLLLGGITLDLWRGLEQRRALASIADAAAVAGANGIDEAAARRGEIRLSPDRVRRFVARSLAMQAERRFDIVELRIEADAVTVVLRGRADLTLSRLSGSTDPIAYTVSARAAPRRVP